MERFVSGLGIELDVEAFVKCCRGNMDLSDDDACVPSADVQQMGLEDDEEDGAEYVEYTEAPEFYVVDAECYYGEVNMEAATDDANPWADMVDEAPIPDAVHDRSYQVALREARGRVLRKMCDGWGECLACSLKSKKTRYGNGPEHFLTIDHGRAEQWVARKCEGDQPSAVAAAPATASASASACACASSIDEAIERYGDSRIVSLCQRDLRTSITLPSKMKYVRWGRSTSGI